MLSVSIAIRSLLTGLLLFGFFYVIGRFILRVTANSKNARAHSIFETVTVGLLITISGYAITITGGKTLLLPVPFLLAALLLADKVMNDQVVSTANKTFIWFGILSIILFFIYYLQAHISLDSKSFRFASSDNSYYARLASSINSYGVETPKLYFPGIDNYRPEPYHYIDIWTTALISKFTGLNSHYALSIVMYPVFAAIFSVGMFEAAVKRYGNRLTVQLISLFTVFFSGIGIFFPKFLLSAEVYDYAPIIYTKALFPGIIILLALHYYSSSSFNKLFIISMCGGLGFITMAPSFALVLFPIFVYRVFIKKDKLYTYWPSVAALLFTIIYVGYLYRGGSGQVNIINETKLSFLRRLAAIFFGGGLQFFMWIPVLLLLITNRKKVVADSFISGFSLLVFLSLAGLFAWSVFWPFTIEAVQFFSIIFLPVSAILTGMTLLAVTANSNKITLFLVFLLSGYLITKNIHYNFHVQSVSRKDVQELQAFTNNFSGRFANYKTPGDFKNIFELHTMIFPPMPWINYYNEQYQNYSLNSIEILRDSTTLEGKTGKMYIRQSPYYQFTQKRKNDLTGDMKKAFLKDYNITYLMISPKSQLEPGLYSLVADSLVLSDGWRVFKINFSPL